MQDDPKPPADPDAPEPTTPDVPHEPKGPGDPAPGPNDGGGPPHRPMPPGDPKPPPGYASSSSGKGPFWALCPFLYLWC